MSGQGYPSLPTSLPFREEGLYRFEVAVDGDSLASLEIPVWLIPPRWSLLDVH